MHLLRPALAGRRPYPIAFPIYPPSRFGSSSRRWAVVLVRRRVHGASVRCIRNSRWDRQGGTMKGKGWDSRFVGVVAMGLAVACESRAPIAAPSTSRPGEFSASAAAPAAAAHIGWEIFSSASATAADGLKIIVTGTGTFVAPAGGGETSSAATGGGTWETRDASDAVTGSGNYMVTGLVRWERALASVPRIPGRTAGLAILRVEYDDGSAGTLTISCRISNAQPGRFEGVTASKGFVDFWNRVASPNLFHVLD